MPIAVPAICPNGHVVPNVISLNVGAVVSGASDRSVFSPGGMRMSGNLVECHVCGEWAEIPDGLYEVVGDTARIPQAAYENVLKLLRLAQSATPPDRDAVIAGVEKMMPSLAPTLRRGRGLSEDGWIALIVGVITFLTACVAIYVQHGDAQRASAIAERGADLQQQQLELSRAEAAAHRNETEFQQRVTVESLDIARRSVEAQLEANRIQREQATPAVPREPSRGEFGRRSAKGWGVRVK